MIEVHINKLLMNEDSVYNGGILEVSSDLKCFVRVHENGLRIDEISSTGSFVFGTIRDLAELKRRGYNNFSGWNLRVSDYMPFITDRFVNYKGSYFKMVCQLDDGDVGKFCKSDSGLKVWPGQVIDRGMLGLIRDKCQSDDMLFLSEAKTIGGEARCWVFDGRVVHCCRYHDDRWGKNDSLVDLKHAAEKMVMDWEPADMYTIDMCHHENSIKIMEYNCISASGFYSSDVRHIVKCVVKSKFGGRNG